MTPQELLLLQVASRYSEWLEHAGDQSQHVMIQILAGLLLREKMENEYLKKISF